MRDKRAKFKELAQNRVTRAIRDIRLIGNLANRSAYEYTDEDIRKIYRTLRRELDGMRGLFGSEEGGTGVDFTLE